MLRSVFKSFELLKTSTVSRRLAFSSVCSEEEESIYQLTRKSMCFNETDGFIVNSPYGNISMPKTSIERFIWNDFSLWSDREAFVCGVTGRSYTHGKVRDHSAALAIRLRKFFNVNSEDVCAICFPNVPEYAIVLMGIIESGAAATTVNPVYTPEEMSRQFVDSKPKVIFCVAANCDVVSKAVALAKLANVTVVALKTNLDQSISNGIIDLKELIDVSGLNLIEASSFNENINLDKTIALPYSSGTTGMPKGVMHSHNSIISMVASMSVNMFKEPISLPTTSDFQEVLPCFLPFYHIYGLVIMIFHKLYRGCKVVSMPKYDAELLLKISVDQKATVLNVVPPVAIALANYSNAKPEHFRSIRKVVCGAAPLAQADVDRFKKLVPQARFTQGFGMTEGIVAVAPDGLHSNFATVGPPLANQQMKICAVGDPTFKGLAANETGELLVRGPSIMNGYYKNESATKETILNDGFLRTGDIGHYDQNGLFYITERLKELIKVKTYQVPPAELESILRTHPELLDAVVVGIPHEKFGEVPKAFVVRRPNSQVNEKNVQEFVAKQVIHYKQLTGGVVFIDIIPKSPSGKILRREVKRLYC